MKSSSTVGIGKKNKDQIERNLILIEQNHDRWADLTRLNTLFHIAV